MKNFELGDKVQHINKPIKGEIFAIYAYKVQIKDEHGFIEELLLTEICHIPCENIYAESLKNVVKLKDNKEVFDDKKTSKKHIEKSSLIVDLHIHEITSSIKHMTNHEMVLLQLKKVNETLKIVDKRKYNKIIFIHGVGTGKLRAEIEYLLYKKQILFQEASYAQYGQGAIEVIL